MKKMRATPKFLAKTQYICIASENKMLCYKIQNKIVINYCIKYNFKNLENTNINLKSIFRRAKIPTSEVKFNK